MILITPDLLPKSVCDELIKIHTNNEDNWYEYNDTKTLDIKVVNSDDYVPCLKYQYNNSVRVDK